MRILYLSQYFPPEVGATQTRAYEMARNLVGLGHRVTMLAEIPNHPTGIVPPEYRGKLYERDTLDGIDVMRLWVKTSRVKTTRTRMAFYLSFMVSATLAGILLARGRYDVVYATSPPLFVACAGWALSRIRRIPFVFEVRDLWPAVAVSLGELSSPRIIRWAEAVERFLYRQAAAIVAVTRGFCQHIEALGIASDKIHWIPNGTMPEIFDPARGDEGLRHRLGLQGKFVVLYAGLHGLAQGLPFILEAAHDLLDHPEVVFVFVGEGPAKPDLLAIQDQQNLTNVLFLPQVAREAVVPYLNMADTLLVPLKKDQIFASFIPSKLYDFMSCAKPVILSVPGEAREILEEAGAGIFVAPGDVKQLRQAILHLSREAGTCQEYGRKGRQYVIEHFSRKTQAGQVAALLQDLIDR